MSDYSDLLTELSNHTRIHILFLLKNESKTLTNIAESLNDISKAEVSRHLSRLLKRGFIQKEEPSGRKYEISPFGRIFILMFNPIDFIFEHNKYFKRHSISDLPEKLIREIDSLKNSKFITGAGKVMHKIKSFNNSPAQEKSVMISTAFPFETESVKEAYYLLNKEVLKNEERQKQNHPDTKYHIRILDSIPIAIAFNNLGEGMISFPRIKEKKPDYSETIVITDKKGLEYLKEIWNFFWDKAETP